MCLVRWDATTESYDRVNIGTTSETAGITVATGNGHWMELDGANSTNPDFVNTGRDIWRTALGVGGDHIPYWSADNTYDPGDEIVQRLPGNAASGFDNPATFPFVYNGGAGTNTGAPVDPTRVQNPGTDDYAICLLYTSPSPRDS